MQRIEAENPEKRRICHIFPTILFLVPSLIRFRFNYLVVSGPPNHKLVRRSSTCAARLLCCRTMAGAEHVGYYYICGKAFLCKLRQQLLTESQSPSFPSSSVMERSRPDASFPPYHSLLSCSMHFSRMGARAEMGLAWAYPHSPPFLTATHIGVDVHHS
jgi:hypothetical protein